MNRNSITIAKAVASQLVFALLTLHSDYVKAVTVEVLNGSDQKIQAFIASDFPKQTVKKRGQFFAAMAGDKIEAVVHAVVRPDYLQSQTYELYVPEPAWASGAGTAVLSKAMARFKGKTHRILLDSNDALARQKLADLRFKAVRTTVIAQIDVNAALAQLNSQRLADGIAIRSLENANQVTLKHWVQAHVRHYQATHAINPIRKKPTAQWQSLFAGDDMVPAESFYAESGGQMIGHVSLRKEANAWWFGWMGVSASQKQQRVIAINQAMALAVLKVAQGHGASVVSIEADSTDPQVYRLLESLPHKISETLITYQRR